MVPPLIVVALLAAGGAPPLPGGGLAPVAQTTPTVVPGREGMSGPVAPHGVLYYLPFWPKDNTLLSAVLTLGTWIVLALLAYWFLFIFLRVFVGQTRTQADDIILRTVRAPLFVGLATYGLLTALAELSISAEVASFLNTIYVVVLLIAVFYLAWRIVKEVLLRWLAFHVQETETSVDDLFVPLLNTLGPLVTVLACTVFVLQYLGVNVGLVVASIGAIGLVMGLAFQSSLSNLFSGIYLMLDPPFQQNDVILLPDGKVCRVQQVGLRNSRLYDMATNSMIFVPNNNLTEANIVNITRPSVDIRVASSVKVPSTADPERVCRLLTDVLYSHPHILGIPTDKMRVLRGRILRLLERTGLDHPALATALEDLYTWESIRRYDNRVIRDQLNTLHKQMNSVLAEAERALQPLAAQRQAASAVAAWRLALGGGVEEASREGLEAGRMRQIESAAQQLGALVPGGLPPALTTALESLRALDTQENTLQATIAREEQAHEAELDRLIAALVTAGRQAATRLQERGQAKAGARLDLWTRALVVQYAEQAVLDSVDGLDQELGDLVDWMHEMEAGGLTKAERTRVLELFGRWGGVWLLEQRRVVELRRRLRLWLQWKEENVVPRSEYTQIQEAWERRLRQLSRRLRGPLLKDEQALEDRLLAARAWLHSDSFVPPLADWKLPTVELDAFSDSELEFGLNFYVDDIRLEHFGRPSRVSSDVLGDIYEAFAHETLEPSATSSNGATNGASAPQAMGAPKGVSARAPASLLRS